MLLILAPNPTFAQNDGYMQRVREIDALFADVPRVYLEHGKKWKSVGLYPLGNKSYKLSIPFYCDQMRLCDYLSPSFNSVYIHSIYQFEIHKNFLIRAVEKHQKEILLDLHGIVPEETFLASNNKRLTNKWNQIEKLSVTLAEKVICVTDKMKMHIKNKYSISEEKFISLPIIREEAKEKNDIDFLTKIETYIKSPRYIYAGGSQKWQRIEIMASAINNSKLSGAILSPNKKDFKKLVRKEIPIKSTTQVETINELKQAHFSFVLREDHIVNQVACPTKLIEAMIYGCLPVVESPNLGDFNDLGFSFLPLEDFNSTRLPSADEYFHGIKNNKKIIAQLLEKYRENNAQFISTVIKNETFTTDEFNSIDRIAKAERTNSFKSFIFSKKIFSPRNIYKTGRFFT